MSPDKGAIAKRGSGDLKIHRVAEDVWLYRGFFSNSAVFVFPSSVVVIDSQVSPIGGERLKKAIASITDRPIRYVINTHFHGDHTGGNGVFAGAQIIGSDLTARFARERDGERVEYAKTFGLEFQDFHETALPTRTFDRELVLDIDGDELRIARIGAAETEDACVVHWPSHDAVATGDGVATWEYPFLGTPFVDEGLHDDGEWIRFLGGVRALKPRALVPGHGPALVGEDAIGERCELLSALMSDLVSAVKLELRAGTPIDRIVDNVQRALAHYPVRADLHERTVSQRFAIYRCINSLLPERKGKGWWHDLRPSIIARGGARATQAELLRIGDSREALLSRAERLAEEDRPLAIAVLEAWTERRPRDADAHALLSDVLFDGAEGIDPKVDATEYFGASSRAAKAALAADPTAKLALLNLGCLEVFGGMILAQRMAPAIAKIEAALASRALTPKQRRKACFFLGKAHQMEGRDAESDESFRDLFPAWLRPLFPLAREHLRAFP